MTADEARAKTIRKKLDWKEVDRMIEVFGKQGVSLICLEKREIVIEPTLIKELIENGFKVNDGESYLKIEW